MILFEPQIKTSFATLHGDQAQEWRQLLLELGRHSALVLGETRAFPSLQVVASDEAGGKLEQMLERAARLAVFLTLLKPAMILVMGGIVLLIVLAILLPIIEINQLVR